ncbi:MAG TPA: hypothetical protein VMX38_13035, partial [Verrucomicrobiae bacterium]|nr:hypothetical protein [Verrucomicrobiae bacterium]
SRAKIDLDDLAHARERLGKLSNENLENAIAHARADLRSRNTMYIPNKDSVETNADFSVLASSGKALEFHPITAGDKTTKFIVALESAKSPIVLFASAGVEIPLRGALTCHSEDPQCRFQFLNPEDALNLARTELAAASATPALTQDPHIYENPAMGMRVSLPDEWRLIREEPGSFSRPHNAVFGKSGTTAMFMLTREHFEGSPDLYGKMLEAFFAKRGNFQRTGVETVKQDGLSGTRWNINWTESGIDYSAVIEMFGVGDDYYRITTLAPKEVYSRYAEAFENIIRSVQFPLLRASPQILDSQK